MFRKANKLADFLFLTFLGDDGNMWTESKIMNNKPQVIGSTDFVKMLIEKRGRISTQLVVQHDVHIKGDEELKSLEHLDLDNIIFNGMVFIEKFGKLITLSLGSSSFLHGLYIQGNKSKHISIAGCDATTVDFHRCDCESVWMRQLKVERSLDLSGLNLKGMCTMTESSYGELELVCSNGSEPVARIKQVKTDDPIAAVQFRMMGAAVFMSTANIRKALKDGTLSAVA